MESTQVRVSSVCVSYKVTQNQVKNTCNLHSFIFCIPLFIFDLNNTTTAYVLKRK